MGRRRGELAPVCLGAGPVAVGARHLSPHSPESRDIGIWLVVVFALVCVIAIVILDHTGWSIGR
jgi:hypothetical protein